MVNLNKQNDVTVSKSSFPARDERSNFVQETDAGAHRLTIQRRLFAKHWMH